VGPNYFEVVVLGTGTGALVSGALLARRGFRVLVLGHDDLPGDYSHRGYRMQRSPFSIAGAEAGPLRRILQELALTQHFRRRTTTEDPLFQVVLPKHRIDFWADPDARAAELQREFPELTRPMDAFYQALAQHDADLERIFERDLVFPPEAFFERREVARVLVQSPFGKKGVDGDLFGEMPEGHPFRAVVLAQARAVAGQDPDAMSPLELTRLHALWSRGVRSIEGDREGWRRLLFEKIQMHSGEVRERDRVDEILVKRGRVVGVRIAGHDEPTGCQFVVVGGDAHAALARVPEDAWPRRTASLRTRVRPRALRWVLNVVLATEGIPEGMARDVFLVCDPNAPLAEENLLRVQALGEETAGVRTLTVECLVPFARVVAEASYVPSLREKALASLRQLVPFLDRHVRVIDSPCDGLPIDDREKGETVEPEEPWTRTPNRMEALYETSADSVLGVTGLPIRLGIKGLLLAGPQSVPGLGFEGLLLAAWSAARLVTKSDRKKERMRKEMWSKIEI
jgi:glycine/D-amino acid oxidase-like deaminating enzyme